MGRELSILPIITSSDAIIRKNTLHLWLHDIIDNAITPELLTVENLTIAMHTLLSDGFDELYANLDHNHDDLYYQESEIDAILSGKLGLETGLQVRMWTGLGKTTTEDAHEVFLEEMSTTSYLLFAAYLNTSPQQFGAYVPYSETQSRAYLMTSTLTLSSALVTYASRMDDQAVFGAWDNLGSVFCWIGYPAASGRGVSRAVDAPVNESEILIDLLKLASNVDVLKKDVADLKNAKEMY